MPFSFDTVVAVMYVTIRPENLFGPGGGQCHDFERPGAIGKDSGKFLIVGVDRMAPQAGRDRALSGGDHFDDWRSVVAEVTYGFESPPPATP